MARKTNTTISDDDLKRFKNMKLQCETTKSKWIKKHAELNQGLGVLKTQLKYLKTIIQKHEENRKELKAASDRMKDPPEVDDKNYTKKKRQKDIRDAIGADLENDMKRYVNQTTLPQYTRTLASYRAAEAASKLRDLKDDGKTPPTININPASVITAAGAGAGASAGSSSTNTFVISNEISSRGFSGNLTLSQAINAAFT